MVISALSRPCAGWMFSSGPSSGAETVSVTGGNWKLGHPSSSLQSSVLKSLFALSSMVGASGSCSFNDAATMGFPSSRADGEGKSLKLSFP